MKKKRIVVTGMGVLTSNGLCLGDFRNNLINAKSGIQKINELQELNFNCQVGGVPSNVDYKFIEKIGYVNSSQYTKYALIAAKEALNFSVTNIDTDYNTGIIIGTGFGAIDSISNSIIPKINEKKIKNIKSTEIEGLMLSAPSAILAGIIGAGNICFSNSNACATGTDAIIMGYERIKTGMATKMVVGSSDCFSPYYWALFDVLRATNRYFNDTPEKASRPMSESARGFVPSAGAGIIVLEELENAYKNNSKIYAEIIGGYMNCGGQRNGGTMTFPNSESVVKCISEAIKNANITPDKIDLISGHLTGTKADPVEISNWVKGLGLNFKQTPYINAPKSMIGHTLGASGSIETVAAILQLHYDFVHPSINSEDLHPDIAKMIPREKIPLNCIKNAGLKYVAKASFGFGDVNSCVILKKID